MSFTMLWWWIIGTYIVWFLVQCFARWRKQRQWRRRVRDAQQKRPR